MCPQNLVIHDHTMVADGNTSLRDRIAEHSLFGTGVGLGLADLFAFQMADTSYRPVPSG